ncbi:hypothetical protein P700755_003367 [Psychroflexus torquis ATCC 700755]|uniref:Uncharacterized protein n=1 Tax=Psychroflexus torquis (strain ATCC 700755 / CIP 106069 / ACAM 623) TaxID=313595 RepID=K4IHL1_PSYTT|nr:hypothetical protein P700755_003367 [Psychroflexus torquis ATCC 700755]
MMFPRTNLKDQLDRVKFKKTSNENILKEVESIFSNVDAENTIILNKIASGDDINFNNFNTDKLESSKIYHINQIEQICINYRLRFLDSKYFKGKLPYEAISKIKTLEEEHETDLKGFKIMAPSKLFKLENADDPLLFAPIGNDYYYLIHKWGNDLSPFRRIMMWPFKTFENFIFFALFSALVCTFLVPSGFFMDEDNLTTEFILLYLFMFKWIGGVSIFYGFSKGKNFNTAIWRSKYYNA